MSDLRLDEINAHQLAVAEHRVGASVPEGAHPLGERLDFACNIIYVTYMARGSSGRIVIEVERALKEKLYLELTRRDLTLKAWFIDQATRFLEESRHPLLFAEEDFTGRKTQARSGTLRSLNEASK